MNNWKTFSFRLTLARFCSGLVFVVLRYVLRYRYQTIHHNLTSAFPSYKPSQIAHLVERYYHHLSDLCVEPFLFAIASPRLRSHLARFTNTELLHRLHQAQKPVIMFASHYGNWEYLIRLPMYSPYPVYTAYSPPRQPWMNRLLLRLRGRFGVHLIPRASFYRQALGRLRQADEPALVVVIADQRPGPGSLKHQLMFLQHPTFVQVGAERLARQTGAEVILVDCVKTDRFCYQYRLKRVNWERDEPTPLALTQLYYEHLAEQIHRSPAFWLWSHDRWKASVEAPEVDQPVAV